MAHDPSGNKHRKNSRSSQALREGDTLVVWKLDRLGRSLRHLVNVVHDLTSRGIGLRVLTGQGAAIDTTTPAGKLVFGIFASLAEFERDLISERTRAGLASARARGRKGGRRPKMTPAKLRLAMAAMGKPETNVGDLCRELGITRSTLYRHVSPTGEPRADAARLPNGRRLLTRYRVPVVVPLGLVKRALRHSSYRNDLVTSFRGAIVTPRMVCAFA